MRIALVLACGTTGLLAGARVAPAQAGDAKPGEKNSTAPDKTPPAPSELKLLRTVDKDRNEALGSMEGGPHALAFSPDGSLLGVGNQDGAVSVVEIGGDEASTKWRRLAAHEGAVNALAFLQRGERGLLASVGDDGQITVAPVDSGTETDRKDPLFSRALALGPLTAIAVLNAGPESPRLVVGSGHGGLAVVAISDQVTVEQTIEATPGHDAAIVGLVPLAANKVALAGFDGTVRVLEVPSGKELRAQKVAQVELTGIAASTDKQILAVGSWHKGVTLLDAGSLKTLATPEPHPGVTTALALAGTGGGVKGLVLVTASIFDECAAVSEPWKDTLAATRRTKIKGAPSAIAVSQDSKRFAVANFDGGIEIYKLPKSASGGTDAKGEDSK